MKKNISKLILLFSTTSFCLSPLVITSCKTKKKTYIDETTITKDKQAEEGSASCSFEFSLVNPISEGQKLVATRTITSSSQEGLDVTIPEQLTVEEKTVKFTATLSVPTTNNKTTLWSIFDLDVACKDSSNNNAWTQKITGFKITIKADTEKHQLSVESKAHKVSIACDMQQVNETTPFNITIKNERTSNIDDVYLSYVVNNQAVVESKPIRLDAGGEIKYENLTKQAISQKFVDAGKSAIGDNDQINFVVSRVGSYVVNESNNHLSQIQEDGSVRELTYNEIMSIENTPVVYKTTIDGQTEYKTFKKEVEGEFVLGSFKDFILTCVTSQTYDLYFLKGLYTNEGYGHDGNITLKIHGIKVTNESNEEVKTATLDTCIYKISSNQSDSGLYAGGLNFYLDNLNIHGRTEFMLKYIDTHQEFCVPYNFDGLMCPTLVCNNCDFVGRYTLWGGCTTTASFTNCTFDTSDCYFDSGDKWRNANAMWLYGDVNATFDGCTFYSGGKNLKFYGNGKTVATTSTIKNCTFIFAYSKWRAKMDEIKGTEHNKIEIEGIINSRHDSPQTGGDTTIYFNEDDQHVSLNNEFSMYTNHTQFGDTELDALMTNWQATDVSSQTHIK